jgi:hypothetical protein
MTPLRCKACGQRYAQFRGFCRQCERRAGIWEDTKQREQERVEAQHARVEALRRPVEPRPRRRVVIAGVEYEIVGP